MQAASSLRCPSASWFENTLLEAPLWLLQALRAEADGADYLGAGAVFPTGTKESGEALPAPRCRAARRRDVVPGVLCTPHCCCCRGETQVGVVQPPPAPCVNTLPLPRPSPPCCRSDWAAAPAGDLCRRRHPR